MLLELCQESFDCLENLLEFKAPLHLPGFGIGECPPNWSARKLLMCCSVIGMRIRMVNHPFLNLANEEGLRLKKSPESGEKSGIFCQKTFIT